MTDNAATPKMKIFSLGGLQPSERSGAFRATAALASLGWLEPGTNLALNFFACSLLWIEVVIYLKQIRERQLR
jgi:hypothetical protein